MLNIDINDEIIEEFLNGKSDEKYITAIEYDYATNTIYKIIDDPVKGKLIRKDILKGFVWFKKLPITFYKGNKELLRKKMNDYGITIKKLETDNHPRFEEGYKYLAKSSKNLYSLQCFFRDGGLNIASNKDYFISLPPVEQYMIMNSIRLFKGFEEYSELHKMVFDIETTSLSPHQGRVFLIGIKDNRGYEKIISTNLDDDSELFAILSLFNELITIKPCILAGYNSFNFDWDFMLQRCNIMDFNLNDNVKKIHKSLDIKMRETSLKLGGETEIYNQLNIWGFNSIDIAHSVRRAQAINSDIKSWSLKYIAKETKVAKPNRVYIVGDKIGNLWEENKIFYLNENDGKYCKTKPSIEFKEHILREDLKQSPNKIFIFGDNDLRIGLGGQAKEMRGEPNTIGIRTKKIPDVTKESYYNDNELEDNKVKILEDVLNIKKQIEIGKTIVFPKAGIGTGLAKLKEKAPLTFDFLIENLKMLKEYANSFNEVNGQYIVTRYLMDDIQETLDVDNVYGQQTFFINKLIPTTFQKTATMGNAAIWSQLMYEWSYNNDLSIPIKEKNRKYIGGISMLFSSGYNKRIVKFDFNSLYPAIQLTWDAFSTTELSGVVKPMLQYFFGKRDILRELGKNAGDDKKLKSFYKAKEQPIKILNNSNYGSIGSTQFFNWSDIEKAETITCIARQNLRLACAWFIERGFRLITIDTDGCDFSLPDNVDEYKYIGKGLCPKIEKDKIYEGYDGYLAEFNDLYMRGKMGLGFDGEWTKSINFSRKNYIKVEPNGKIKMTGNSFKNRLLSEYKVDFLNKAIELILDEDGAGFIEYYYDYIDKLYNKKIPIIKIANKSKVKLTIDEYEKRKLKKNKNGGKLGAMAHMDLLIENKLDAKIGEVIYYVNNGKVKSAGDIGNTYIIDSVELENNPELCMDYNVPKYVAAFNKFVEPLLIVFKPEVRNRILVKTPEDREFFVASELDMINSIPIDKDKQDSLDALFTPEDREFKFWEKYNYNPDMFKPFTGDFYIPDIHQEIKKENIENDFICNSGGAEGSDTIFEEYLKKYHIKTNIFSFNGHSNLSKNIIILNDDELTKNDDLLINIAKKLNRTFPSKKEYTNNLIRRNYYQISNSDEIFAIGNLKEKNIVEGGTGWGVEIAKFLNKPIYLYNQIDNKWYKYDNEEFILMKYYPIVTSKRFAGIGTRDLTIDGENAIKELLDRSFLK